MGVGALIKKERVKREIKQAILAKGICTSSYLSRIENEKVEPNEEIVRLLLERLSIPFEILGKKNKTNEIVTLEFLKQIYKDVIKQRNRNYTKSNLKIMDSKIDEFILNSKTYFTYLAIRLRFLILLEEDLLILEMELKHLENNIKQYDWDLKYLCLINAALIFYKKGHINKTIEILNSVYDNKSNIDADEIAELHYMFGLAYASQRNYLFSHEYTKKALDYFLENVMINRVLDSYIIIGICYKATNRLEMAMDIYKKAEHLSEKYNLPQKTGIIYHNLGSLYSSIGNSEVSLTYFFKSIYVKKFNKDKLVTILAIVIEYSKLKNGKELLAWCEKGFEIIGEDNKWIIYKMHLDFYYTYYSLEGLSKEKVDNIICFFEKKMDYISVLKYSMVYAEFLVNSNKYRTAAIYYQKAFYSYMKHNNLSNWEDLI